MIQVFYPEAKVFGQDEDLESSFLSIALQFVF